MHLLINKLYFQAQLEQLVEIHLIHIMNVELTLRYNLCLHLDFQKYQNLLQLLLASYSYLNEFNQPPPIHQQLKLFTFYFMAILFLNLFL